MAQTSALIKALKAELKRNGYTYLDVAEALNLSEPSIKRMFAEEHITLQRLDKICELIGMELSDLALRVQDNNLVSRLTVDQEEELVSDDKLLLVAICVLNRWDFEEIKTQYTFSAQALTQYLHRLSRLKLISFQKNKIKILISRNFSWITNGPIQRFFHQKMQAEFFSSKFDAEGEKLNVINGMLSVNSNAVLQKRIDRLVNEFTDLDNEDAKLSNDKRFGTTMVVAIRPWELESFEKLRREGMQKTFK